MSLDIYLPPCSPGRAPESESRQDGDAGVAGAPLAVSGRLVTHLPQRAKRVSAVVPRAVERFVRWCPQHQSVVVGEDDGLQCPAGHRVATWHVVDGRTGTVYAISTAQRVWLSPTAIADAEAVLGSLEDVRPSNTAHATERMVDLLFPRVVCAASGPKATSIARHVERAA